MTVSIIIVNHNTPHVLRDCIESVQKFEKAGTFEIIIVDNNSTDDSPQIISELAKRYSNVKVLFTQKLESFSFANNLGIRYSKGEYVLIMNPDIIFTEKLLEKLVERMEDNPGYGAISPALVGTNGIFQRNYFQRYPTIKQFIFYSSLLAPLFNTSAKRMNKYLENQEIDISTKKIYTTEQIPCAFIMIKKELLENIGLMDDKFVLFFEDVDLSYRINKTHKLAVDTTMSVVHLGGTSFKTENNWWLHGRFIRSMVYFFQKHYSPSRTFLLKLLVRLNSYIILLYEGIRTMFGKHDDYRILKHKHLIKLMREEK